MTAHRPLRSPAKTNPWRAAVTAAWLATLLVSAQAGATCPPTAQALTEPEVRQGLRDAQDRGLLWRLEKGGRISWLYGTLHVARQAWMFPGPQVRGALMDSDVLALELDLLDPAIVARLQRALLRPPGAAPLPPDLQARLERAAEAACVGTSLSALRPEVQVSVLAALALRADGLDPAWGVDGFLAGLGRGLNRTVVSLETPEQQAEALAGPVPAQNERGLQQALSQLESGHARTQMMRLALAWAQSDHDTLARYTEWCECVETEQDRADMRRLLDERNGPLAQRLTQMHDRGQRVFMAVGALHMMGPQGLPALLQAQGFQVQRQRFALPESARQP